MKPAHSQSGYYSYIAQVLDVAPETLNVPDIDSYIGLMHTLFVLEDIYGITVSKADGEICLKVNGEKGKDAAEVIRMLAAWKKRRLSSMQVRSIKIPTTNGVTTILSSTQQAAG